MADKTTLQDLKNIKLLELYEKYFADKVAFFNEAEDADWFVKNIGPIILQNKSELDSLGEGVYKRYYDLFILNKWVSLSVRPDEEVLDLFKNYFTYIFRLPENIDIWGKYKSKLQFKPFLEDRDEFKSSTRKVLSENIEVLTKGEIVLAGKKYSGTIGNWLRDYVNKVGAGKIDRLKKEEYLVNSDNTKSLDENDKKKLYFIINFFERLKVSSEDVEGFEEPITVIGDDGKMMSLREGRFEPIDPRIIKALRAMKEKGLIDEIPQTLIGRVENNKMENREGIKEAKNTKGNNNTDSIQAVDLNSEDVLRQEFNNFIRSQFLQDVLDKSDSMTKEIGRDIKKLRNNFYTAVNNKDRQTALATIFVLTQNGQIREVFATDDRFVKFWSGQLEKIGLNVQEFKNDPAEEKYLARFFKYILENRLKMSEKEALMSGVVISNLARESGELEYQDMVYGDLESGKFNWNI